MNSQSRVDRSSGTDRRNSPVVRYWILRWWLSSQLIPQGVLKILGDQVDREYLIGNAADLKVVDLLQQLLDQTT